MSLLSIVQDVCMRVNIPSPSIVAASTDNQILQMMAIATKEGEVLSNRYDWQRTTLETTFTTTAVQLQGTVSTIMPGLKNIINSSMWNRTLRRPIFGPLTAQRYEQLQAANMVGPWTYFIIQGDNFLMFPLPGAGQVVYLEYTSQYFCASSLGVPQPKFLADTDNLLLREDVFKLGMEWRWKKVKGLDYSEDFNEYENMLSDAKATDGSKDVINMGDTRYDIYPGVIVPSGSWPVI
jgi:hypothetical protein